MMIEKGELASKPAAEKKAYSTPVLVTHGSVAKLTQHNSCGGNSDADAVPFGTHHKYRWWDHIF